MTLPERRPEGRALYPMELVGTEELDRFVPHLPLFEVPRTNASCIPLGKMDISHANRVPLLVTDFSAGDLESYGLEILEVPQLNEGAGVILPRFSRVNVYKVEGVVFSEPAKSFLLSRENIADIHSPWQFEAFDKEGKPLKIMGNNRMIGQLACTFVIKGVDEARAKMY